MKENYVATHLLRISSNVSGQRIDNFLYVYLKSIPKSMIYRIIRTGRVRVNKKKVKFQYKLQIGDCIKIPAVYRNCDNVLDIKSIKKIKFLLRNTIIYEDDHLLILNKPVGISVHRGSGLSFGMIEGLRELHPEMRFLELVHRLDRATSGVLLLAKKRTALIYLQEQLRLQKMKKEYLALVHGAWNSCIKDISIPLFKKKKLKKNFRTHLADAVKGKLSITNFCIKERFDNMATLLLVTPITGRTHQIRIHSQYANHPIIGDNIYGNYNFDIKFKKIGLNRLFLHASKLSFYHPNTGQLFCVSAPVDQLFHNCLLFLRRGIINE